MSVWPSITSKTQHSGLSDGRFIVPLPKKPGALLLSESRSQAVRRFLSFERSLHSKGHFGEFGAGIDGHAEQVPASDLDKSTQGVFYLPMHALNVRHIFESSAKSQTGVAFE